MNHQNNVQQSTAFCDYLPVSPSRSVSLSLFIFPSLSLLLFLSLSPRLFLSLSFYFSFYLFVFLCAYVGLSLCVCLSSLLKCSPASEARAMMRLLRVTEGQPPVIFRFTETPGDTPREVLERAQAAVRKALKGDAGAGRSKTGVAEGGTKGTGKGKAGKDGRWV